jgi:hypothetical protein
MISSHLHLGLLIRFNSTERSSGYYSFHLNASQITLLWHNVLTKGIYFIWVYNWIISEATKPQSYVPFSQIASTENIFMQKKKKKRSKTIPVTGFGGL